jgi:hypothetical protein
MRRRLTLAGEIRKGRLIFISLSWKELTNVYEKNQKFTIVCNANV